MTYTGTLHDVEDSLGLGGVDVLYSFAYTINPGDPGCRRTADGDGWPSEPASVEMDKLEIVQVLPCDGKALPVPLTAAWMERVYGWTHRKLEADWVAIETEILRDSAEPSCDDLRDD
jgi:hypothetical protein